MSNAGAEKRSRDHRSHDQLNWRKTGYGKRAVCDCAADSAVCPRRAGFYRGAASQEGNRAQVETRLLGITRSCYGGSFSRFSLTISSPLKRDVTGMVAKVFARVLLEMREDFALNRGLVLIDHASVIFVEGEHCIHHSCCNVLAKGTGHIVDATLHVSRKPQPSEFSRLRAAFSGWASTCGCPRRAVQSR